MKMSKIFSFLSLTICLALSSACTKGSTPGAPATGSNAPAGSGNMDGTYAGGGGNGINGTAIESYHQDISTLPEFKTYLVPIFERMAQSSPDVFVGYLNWVIHHKAWYFVPVALPNLPKEKTALAFPSDQLALHSESEIYIDAKAYNAKPLKDRAYLLMHEMVMGARLLMKHSAKTQCLALNTDQASNSCDSPDVLKLAVSPPDSPDDKPTLTGSDDEAVRSMTVFLLTRDQDYSGPNVRSFRIGLGFNYPWDRVVSTANLDTVSDALDRHDLTGDVLETTLPGQTQVTPCQFDHSRYNSEFSLTPTFLYALNPAAPLANSAPPITEAGDASTTSTGVLDPRGGENTGFVDRVHSEPLTSSGQSIVMDSYNYDFYITREEHPRLIRVDLTRVKIIPSPRGGRGEVVPVHNFPVISCKVKD